jgi:hypothetical protein
LHLDYKVEFRIQCNINLIFRFFTASFYCTVYDRILILKNMFVDRCLSFCTFSFGHCVVCPSSIYGFWLPLWYHQILLIMLLYFFLRFYWRLFAQRKFANCLLFKKLRYVLLTVYNDKISFIKHTDNTLDFCKWLIRSDYIKINVNNYRNNTRSLFILLSTHHFFRNACTKSGSLRFSQFSGCWLILSVYIIMSFDFPFVRLFGVR